MFYDSNLYKLDNLLFAEISDVYQKVHTVLVCHASLENLKLLQSFCTEETGNKGGRVTKISTVLCPILSYIFCVQLHIPINQLSLIKPNFETPLPALKPATFPPVFR